MGKASKTHRIGINTLRARYERLEERALLASDLISFVRDINPTTLGSSPQNFAETNGIVYFSAETNAVRHLWRTDGTEAGTYQLTFGDAGRSPAELINVGGVLYFSAADSTGNNPWKSDGTIAGTVRIADINPEVSGQPLTGFVSVGSTVFFTASDLVHGRELWKTDGTEAGTILLKDIRPGSANGYYSSLSVLGNSVYFTANDGIGGLNLWTSNGTPEGTTLVSNAPAEQLIVAGDTIYFYGISATSKLELWASSGTSETTRLLESFSNLSSISQLMYSNDELFFLSGRQLWKTNGAPHNASIIREFPTNAIKLLAGTENALYLVANDGNTERLWKSDGTISGTLPLFDIRTGDAVIATSNAVRLDGDLYFASFSAPNVSGLYRIDGTTGQTYPIIDVKIAGSLTVVTGKLYFSAGGYYHDADFLGGDYYDLELWTSDGTGVGTHRVVDINQEGKSSEIRNFVDLNGVAYFIANDGATRRVSYETDVVLKSDGSRDGTQVAFKIPDQGHPVSILQFNKVGNQLFLFVSTSSWSVQLWVSDGTQSGTRFLKELPENYGSRIDATEFDGKLLFFLSKPVLMISDGTSAGTIVLGNISVGHPSYPTRLVQLGGSIYFSARGGSGGQELWRTDGTPEGTGFIDIWPGSQGSSPGGFVAYRDQLYFTANDGAGHSGLWRTGGTAADTHFVHPVENPFGSAAPVEFEDKLYYLTGDSGTLRLWETDGTPTGARLVKDFGDQSVQLYRLEAYPWGSSLLIPTSAGFWSSDGTTLGTQFLASSPAEVYYNNGHSYLTRQVDANIRLYQIDDRQHPVPLFDFPLPPGTTGHAVQITQVGGMQFIVAPNSTLDTELWVHDLRTPGDANNDEVVDGADYVVWADHFLTTPTSSLTFNEGDFNRDGLVDGADYVLWADNFQVLAGRAAPTEVIQQSSANELLNPSESKSSLDVQLAVDRILGDSAVDATVPMYSPKEAEPAVGSLDESWLAWLAISVAQAGENGARPRPQN